MIQSMDLRVALGFVYQRNFQLFLVRHGFGTVRERNGQEIIKVVEQVPASKVPALVNERAESVARENPWRLQYEPDYSKPDGRGKPSPRLSPRQPEFDLMWFEAYRLGAPVTEEWPVRVRQVVSQYPNGMKISDLVLELGFDKPRKVWKQLADTKDWKQTPTFDARPGRIWNAERQLHDWLAEVADAAEILKLYPR
jgi:hypothetical protein